MPVPEQAAVPLLATEGKERWKCPKPFAGDQTCAQPRNTGVKPRVFTGPWPILTMLVSSQAAFLCVTIVLCLTAAGPQVRGSLSATICSLQLRLLCTTLRPDSTACSFQGSRSWSDSGRTTVTGDAFGTASHASAVCDEILGFQRRAGIVVNMPGTR